MTQRQRVAEQNRTITELLSREFQDSGILEEVKAEGRDDVRQDKVEDAGGEIGGSGSQFASFGEQLGARRADEGQ